MDETKKQRAILVDLDSTLCNCDHRVHHIKTDKTPNADRKGKKNWMKFYEELVNDTPNSWCVELIRGMAHIGVIPLYVTGRPQEYEYITLKWFGDQFPLMPMDNPHFVFCEQYVASHLFMRADKDYRKDCIVKEELYRTFIEPKYDIVFALDDRKQVYQHFRKIGLTCLACAEGDH